jgi:Protein of unknown function (DUF1353)
MNPNKKIHLGQYTGNLILKPLSDGGLMQVVEPFGFLDSKRESWLVPVGAKVDGASIPRALWSLIGSPWTGKYRDASVVHDYYCDVRTRPWKEVHRVFFEAMRVSDVCEQQAKLMYAAVFFAGPRWSQTIVDNTKLLSPIDFPESPGLYDLLAIKAMDSSNRDWQGSKSLEDHNPSKRLQKTLELREIESIIDSDNPSLDLIEKMIDDKATISLQHDNAFLGERIVNIDGVKSLTDV